MQPKREPVRNNQQTYFVTFQTDGRRPFFRNERWCILLIDVMENYRSNFSLHDFIFMQDHIHLLISPRIALERVVQMIKGGFSYRAKRELGWNGEIWQRGFSDHRVRDSHDAAEHLLYIEKNLKSTTSECAQHFNGGTSVLKMDPFPQWLKPLQSHRHNGGTEVPPLQNEIGIPDVEDDRRRLGECVSDMPAAAASVEG